MSAEISEAIILAAGAGKRLAPLTPARSKAMAPVAGRPLIGWVIDMLGRAGITRFVAVIGPNDAEAREYLIRRRDTEIVVQDRPLGAADALRRARDLVRDEFLVSACDSLPTSDHVRELLAEHRSRGNAATLSVMNAAPGEDLSSRSVAALAGSKVTKVIEKPAPGERLSDVCCLPMYAFSPAIFSALEQSGPSKRGEHEILPAVQLLIDSGMPVAAVTAAEREQVTTLEDLLALTLARFPAANQISAEAVIEAGAVIHAPVIIEAGVRIAADATVGPRVLIERGARIEAGATLSECIVTRNALLAAGVRAVRHVIV